MNDYDSFIMTTASSVEGYRIIKQCGLVFGETVLAHDFVDLLGASVENVRNNIIERSKELSGSVHLIEDARNFAYRKMIAQAKERGANAIIAIDSDNTFGSSVMYLSLYGTAVKLIPEEEYEAEKRKAAERRDALMAEEKMKADIYNQQLEKLRKREADGDFDREIAFLKKMNGMDSLMRIWACWEQSGLGSVYGEIDEMLRNGKEAERFYGKIPQDVERIKKQIHNALMRGVAE